MDDGTVETVDGLRARLTALEAELAGARAEAAARAEALAAAQRAGLDYLRRALLAEHAGQVVPELVAGNTAEELEASVERARAAFQAAVAAARAQLQQQRVPPGNAPRTRVDVERLSPLEKIAQGLRR